LFGRVSLTIGAPRWLLKLCAQAAADATTSNGDENTPSSSSSKSLSIGCESVIRVGRNVSYDQAVDVLARAGRTPDRNYSNELLKVAIRILTVVNK